jgi:hypothetical protein
MMGVKPNKRSSVSILMLLFVLSVSASSFDVAPNDTLILDGEIIEIVQKNRSDVRDSIEEFGKSDLRIRGVNNLKSSVGISLGGFANFVTTTSNLNGWYYLPEWMDQKRDDGFGFDIGIPVRKELASIQFASNKMTIGVELFLGYQSLNWKSITVASEQLDQDSIIGFRREGDQLFLDYVTIIGEPIPVYELDTIDVKINRSTFQTHQIHFKLGPTLSWAFKRDWSLVAFVGVSYRSSLTMKKSADSFWINEDGQYKRLAGQDIALKQYLLSPALGIGMARDFSEQWRIGLNASFVGPGVILNDNAELTWTAWQAGFVCSVVRTF